MGALLFFGASWGFLEAFLGGLLHFAHVPLAGTFMASLSFGLLSIASKNGLTTGQLVVVSLIAGSFKFLDAFLFPIFIFSRQIVNPAEAILIQGLAFAALSHLTQKEHLRALFFVPLSLALFSGVSALLFGFETVLRNPIQLVFFNMPVGMALSFAVQRLLKDRTFSVRALSAPWQYAMSSVFLVLALLSEWTFKG